MVQEVIGNSIETLYEITPTNYLLRWAPVLSPAIVLFLFFINQLIDENKRRKEAKRILYYKIHLEPSLKELNAYFKHIDQLLLKGNTGIRTDTQKWSRTLVRIKQKIAVEDRMFVDFCLLILQPSYPHIYKDAIELLNLFKDEIYQILEFGDHGEASTYEAFRSVVRSDLIALLSSPVIAGPSLFRKRPRRYAYHSLIKQ